LPHPLIPLSACDQGSRSSVMLPEVAESATHSPGPRVGSHGQVHVTMGSAAHTMLVGAASSDHLDELTFTWIQGNQTYIGGEFRAQPPALPFPARPFPDVCQLHVKSDSPSANSTAARNDRARPLSQNAAKARGSHAVRMAVSARSLHRGGQQCQVERPSFPAMRERLRTTERHVRPARQVPLREPCPRALCRAAALREHLGTA
jgi:hypothetical protein